MNYVKRRPDRIESFLVLETIELSQSKAGNPIFIAHFRNNLNVEFHHYMSFNQRSKVWLYNLLWDTQEVPDFEYLMMQVAVYHEDPFAKIRGKVFKVVWQYDKKYNSYTVNEIYNLEKNFLKRDVCEQRYRDGYWRNLCTLHAGYAKSMKDWPFEFYFKGEENDK